MQMQDVTFEMLSELLESYRSSGLGESRNAKFIESIVTARQMPRGGGVRWLEQVLSLGKPHVCVEQALELESLAEKSRRKDTAGTLLEFALRLRNGLSLTDRQSALVEVLRKQVIDDVPDVCLSDRQHALIHFLIKLKRQNTYYWSARPSISSRIDRVFARFLDEGAISQDDLDYVRQNFKGTVSRFEDSGARHPIGSLRWLDDGSALSILSDTRIDDDVIVIDVLHPRYGMVSVSVDLIYIRRPKNRAT